jgi:hypothetical protein
MSNPLKQLRIPSVARAAANTIANQRQHQEFKKNLADQQARNKDMDIFRKEMSVTEQRIASANVTDEQLQLVALELLPAAEAILSVDMLIAERGYFVTHRKIGHLLPLQYKWTVAGVRIINAVLAKVPVTSQYMDKWDNEIAVHILEIEKDEAARILRNKKYEEENLENFDMLCDEITRLFRMQDLRTRNYKQLNGYLRHGLPMYFRGARGLRLVHAAMKAKIAWAGNWQVEMKTDLDEAVRRDSEYREAKRAGKRYPNQNQNRVNGSPSNDLTVDGGSTALNAMYDDDNADNGLPTDKEFYDGFAEHLKKVE